TTNTPTEPNTTATEDSSPAPSSASSRTPSTASSPVVLPLIGSLSSSVPSTGSLPHIRLLLLLYRPSRREARQPLTDGQSLSTITVRCWPSSDYFVKGSY
ncbi:hypothetical protein Tsubulata_022059, partial [Turnera subulata]